MSKKNKSARVKLIANPDAGKASESADNLKLVIGYLGMNGLKADVVLAKPKGKATPIARQAAKDGYKVVIAMGGDGAVEAVMRGLIGSKVRLGIIPTGMENNISKSLGIPQDLEKACALITSNNCTKLDVGQVTTKKGKKIPFFEMAAVGLSAALYPDATRAVGGKLSGIKGAAPTLIHQEASPKVSLTLDDKSKIEVDTMLVMVSNTPAFGRKFLLAPNPLLEDGLLDISVYQHFGKTELLGYYAKVMDGGYSGAGNVQRYQARKLKVKSSPRMKLMADGVKLGKGTVTIKMRPNALRVISAQEPGLPTPPKDGAEFTSIPTSIAVRKNHREKIQVGPA
jgi:YegS/Rv2252/BmrU family lipid kinase